MELIRGSRETLWGCQQEITKWWAVDEEREMRQLESTREEREEREAMEQLAATEFVDTTVFRNALSH